MGWFTCEDPLVTSVREIYRANVIAAPSSRIQPLDVIAHDGDQFDWRGRLGPVVIGPFPLNMPSITSAPVASLLGQRTSNINMGLAAKLTAKFLSGLGVPVPAASVEATLFKSGRKVSFEVLEVRERSVDLGELGSSLKGSRIDRDNAAVSSVFLGLNPARMLIISRTLESPSFSVHLDGAIEEGVDVTVDAVKELLGAATAAFQWEVTSHRSVTFKGSRAATFAFSAIRCHLGPAGDFGLGMEVEAHLLEPSAGDEDTLFLPIDEPPINSDGLLDLGRLSA